MLNLNLSFQKKLLLLGTLVLPPCWHYFELLGNEHNYYSIISKIFAVATFGDWTILSFMLMNKFKPKFGEGSNWKSNGIINLKFVLIPIIFGVGSLAFFSFSFRIIDSQILDSLGQKYYYSVLSRKKVTGRRASHFGYYYFYTHDHRVYRGKVDKDEYHPGDSIKITYSFLFPSIRKVEKIN